MHVGIGKQFLSLVLDWQLKRHLFCSTGVRILHNLISYCTRHGHWAGYSRKIFQQAEFLLSSYRCLVYRLISEQTCATLQCYRGSFFSWQCGEEQVKRMENKSSQRGTVEKCKSAERRNCGCKLWIKWFKIYKTHRGVCFHEGQSLFIITITRK